MEYVKCGRHKNSQTKFKADNLKEQVGLGQPG